MLEAPSHATISQTAFSLSNMSMWANKTRLRQLVPLQPSLTMGSEKRKKKANPADQKDKKTYDRAEVEALLQAVVDEARREQGNEPTGSRRGVKLVRWNSESYNLVLSLRLCRTSEVLPGPEPCMDGRVVTLTVLYRPGEYVVERG
jgi:hypothetical protein